MGINRTWQTTLSFRKFREKTNSLSRLYWTQQLATDSLLEQLNGKDPNAIATEEIACSFEPRMHSKTVEETIDWLPVFMERNRLHLLVIYTAFLETYLKEITFFHVASLGYVTNLADKSYPIKLTKMGEALASPILKSSTVPEMIKYASELFDISFGRNATEWNKIYKIRCAAAHNGGIATPKFLQGISGTPLALNPQEYENIGLTWDELRTAMKYADEIAALIDSKISNYDIRILETEQVIRELYKKGNLPVRTKLWQLLHNNYSLYPIKRSDKNNFISKFY